MGGVCYSAIRMLSNHEVNDIYITEESVNGDTFLHFFHTVLLPTLNSFDGQGKILVVLVDVASIITLIQLSMQLM